MSAGKPSIGTRLRPTPALVISLLALVLAMGSGAYAAVVAKNSVTSASIKNGEVKTKDLAKNAVKSKNVKDGQLTTSDLASTTVADLNDASTVGGLSVAQLVAAAGGEYVEANQAAGTANVKVLPVNATTVTTLNIPHAGKWLINATLPVQCVYDGSDGANPANPTPAEPFFYAEGKLLVGATVVDTQDQSCEAEAGVVAVIVPIWSGTATVHFTRMITTTGPTTVTLKGSGAASNVLGVDVVPAARTTATASGSKIQAVTVH